LNNYLREALARFGRLIAYYIIEGAARGFGLAFSAFAGIGRVLQYNDESLFLDILNKLPDPDVGDALNDSERAAWGDILLSAAKSMGEDRRSHVLQEAVAFYRALEHPKPFNLQQLGQAHVQLGEHENAERVLEPIVREHPNPWNRYWLSKAWLVLGNTEGALRLVDEALMDPKCTQKYLATMFDHRYEIRNARGDEKANEDLEKACAVCEGVKYKQTLEEKLSAVRAEAQ
jgi:tetratricopeptide (TPR) repeat protein